MAATCSAFAAQPVEYTAAIGADGSTQSITSGNAAITWKANDSVISDSFDSWAIMFTVDQLTVNSLSTYKPVISCGFEDDGSNGRALGLTFAVLGNSANGYTLSLCKTSGGTTSKIAGSSSLTLTAGQECFFAYDSTSHIAYAGIVGGGDVSNMISYEVTEDMTKAFTSGTSRAWTGGGTVQTTMVNGYDMTALSSEEFTQVMNDLATTGTVDAVSPAVPEPATATLSLLALAGLCARRRRK